LSFVNLILLLVACFFLLYGNITGTVIAYRGFLVFVFYVLWDFGTYLLLSLLNGMSGLLTGDPLVIAVTAVSLLASVGAFVSGLFCYIRTSQFLSGRYAKYEMVRLWALLFMIACLIFNGFSVASMLVIMTSSAEEINGISMFLSILEPLSSMLMSVACFFTVLRLRSQY